MVCGVSGATRVYLCPSQKFSHNSPPVFKVRISVPYYRNWGVEKYHSGRVCKYRFVLIVMPKWCLYFRTVVGGGGNVMTAVGFKYETAATEGRVKTVDLMHRFCLFSFFWGGAGGVPHSFLCLLITVEAHVETLLNGKSAATIVRRCPSLFRL